jgi:hypothetical protein
MSDTINTAALATPLSRKATLVAVTIKQWTARKLDKRVTKETNERYHADTDAGRYNKLLIGAEHLNEITKLVSKARALHYSMTQPWADEGPRILPNALFSKFSEEFRVLERDFNAAADRFCAVYPSLIEERKRALNGMFNEEDYPSPSMIRSKFRLDTKVAPLTDASDFRAELDDDTVAEIKAQLQSTTDSVLDGALKDTAERITKVVGHMSERLAALSEYLDNDGKPTKFYDSVVENVRQLADLLPAFNLTNDPKLDALIKRIQSELCVEDAEGLKAHVKARESVKKSADEIVAAVAGIFG